MGSAVHSASVASSLRNLGTRAVSRHCDFAVQFANRVFAAPGIGVVSKPIINQLDARKNPRTFAAVVIH